MVTKDRLGPGWQALAAGDWSSAKAAFEGAADPDSPEVLDGLGRALWWLKDVPGAIEHRTRAYAAYRKQNRDAEAAQVAVWLARELRTSFRNDAAADGWLARAETLSSDDVGDSLPGWVLIARAEATKDVADGISYANEAVATARAQNDADLEIVSLARLGLLRIAAGDVDTGMVALDEAMAAASAGEAGDMQCVGDAYCSLMEAGELLGDADRFAQWTSALTRLTGDKGFGPMDTLGSAAYGNLSSFCGACCGGAYLVSGRLEDADAELNQAISDLEASGLESRCVHPVTQLAELRVLQGRFEEARALLEPYEDLPESIRPLAVLDLALGDPGSARARLERRLGEMEGLTVAALPLHTILVDAQIAAGDLDGAAETSARMRVVADLTGTDRHLGEAVFAEGKVAFARGEETATDKLGDAARALSRASLALPACRARMALARSLVDRDRPLAITEARSALAAFDRLGAVPDADAAASFLRELGVKGRTGPKNLERLTKRELEVLRLIAQGLSNAEIAERLFISVKTSGHHVSNILSKLGLRSRTEAAAFAAIHLGREPATK